MFSFEGSRSEETAAFKYASFYRRAGSNGPGGGKSLGSRERLTSQRGPVAVGRNREKRGRMGKPPPPPPSGRRGSRGGGMVGRGVENREVTCLSVRCRAICQVLGILGPGCFNIETWTVQSGNISSTVVLLGARRPCYRSAILNLALRASPIR